MKSEEVKEVKVPKYEEFNSKEVWKKVKNNPLITCYFKDYGDKRTPNRKYMFNVRFFCKEHGDNPP